MKPKIKQLFAATLAAMSLAPPAQAVLQRAGPVDPANGYPAWYQDTNGMALELCVPTTDADLVAGICFLTNLDVPVLPEQLQTVPYNWALEHFYYYTSTVMTVASLNGGTTKVKVLQGLEASFNTPEPTPGQQITFARWRVQVPQAQAGLACAGSFTIYSPHRAPKTITVPAGARLFDTEDIGIGPDFNGALNGSLGPFATRATAPGGPAAPFATGADGKRYLSVGDLGPITGSGLNNPFYVTNPLPAFSVPPEVRNMPKTNFFAISGPGIATGNCAAQEAVWSVNDVAVIGRVNTTAIASRTNIDRATFRAVDSNNDATPDRFQIGAWAHAVQEVGMPEPVVALSLNKGDPADAVNSTAELAMLKQAVPNTGPAIPGQVATPRFNFFNGVIQPTVAGQAGPAYNHARIRTTTDVPPSMVNVPLVDELRITAASYDNATKELKVTADSGAFLAAQTPSTQAANNTLCSNPCLTLDSNGLPAATAAGAAIDYKMKVAAGAKYAVATITVPNVQLPPAFVTVRSSAGGSDSAPVSYLGAAAGTALFQPDSTSTFMNTPVTIDVLANDIGVAAVPNLLICTAATGGTCAVPNPTATCTVGTASTNCTLQGGKLAIGPGNTVVYTPRANAGGFADTFYYQAASVLGTTLRALVTVNVGNINGLPDARDDLANTGVAGIPLTIDVLANDFAPAGVNLATLRLTAEPQDATGATAAGSAVFTAGKLVFTAPTAGNWTLAYTFNDLNGIVADQGVVAVNAIGAEQIAIQRARWTAPRAPALGTIAVNGTVNISQGQPLQLFVPPLGIQGCPPINSGLRPQGTQIGQTNVVAGGAFDFGAIAQATKPNAVLVFSPNFGGCTQVLVP